MIPCSNAVMTLGWDPATRNVLIAVRKSIPWFKTSAACSLQMVSLDSVNAQLGPMKGGRGGDRGSFGDGGMDVGHVLFLLGTPRP